jgi:hypothetical protein
MTAATGRLAGCRVLIVNRRDIGQPGAGDEEWYLHEIALRWVGWGTRVTWAATRPPGTAARDVIDGVEIVRSAGRYPRRRFDAVVDGTGRLPIMGRRVPVVRVVHRAPVARWRGGGGAIAVPSPATRHELRRGGYRGPIFVVPPGATPAPESTVPVPNRPAQVIRWERSAALLAGIVAHQIDMRRRGGAVQRRYARSDIATVVQFRGTSPAALLRATDEVSVADGVVSVLLNGCDEFDAVGVLDRIGVTNARLRLANWDDLLLGPQGPPLPDRSPLPKG